MMEAMTEANGVNNPYQSDLDVEEYYQTAISKLSGQDIDRYHQLTRESILDVDLKQSKTNHYVLRYAVTHFFTCWGWLTHGDLIRWSCSVVQVTIIE